MKSSIMSLLALGATVSAFPSTMRHGHMHATKRDYSQGQSGQQQSAGGYGLAYDLMADNGACRTAEQISSDVAQLAGEGYSLLRTYDVGCDVGALAAACQQSGLKLFAGINSVSNVQGDLSKLIGMVSQYWDVIDTINIGNEQVNSGAASASQVVSAIGQGRSMLQGAGMPSSVKVVTVDTFVAIIANPELCTASDYCAANAHAFFDGNVGPAGAGDFVKRMQQQVSNAAGGKYTRITESGWPSCGNGQGQAVAGKSQQGQAVSSLRQAFSGDASDLIEFQSTNAVYKAPGPNGAEQCWGIH